MGKNLERAIAASDWKAVAAIYFDALLKMEQRADDAERLADEAFRRYRRAYPGEGTGRAA